MRRLAIPVALALLGGSAVTTEGAEGFPPLLVGEVWTLQGALGPCLDDEPTAPLLCKTHREGFLTLHHYHYNFKTNEEDGRVFFACGTDGTDEVKYLMRYIGDEIVYRDTTVPVTFSVDNEVKFSTVGVVDHVGNVDVVPLSGKDIDTLASAKKLLQINIQEYQPYTIAPDPNGDVDGREVGFGLSDFKTLCQLQLDHARSIHRPPLFSKP